MGFERSQQLLNPDAVDGHAGEVTVFQCNSAEITITDFHAAEVTVMEGAIAEIAVIEFQGAHFGAFDV